MRLQSIPGVVLISLLVSSCGSAATSQVVATPTPREIVVPPSPGTQPSATADRTPSAECVNPPADVLALAYQSDPVTCYRNASLTVDAYLTGAGEIDGPCQDVEPAWLGDCGSFVALYPVLDRSKFSPSLLAANDPSIGKVLEALLDREVRVTGHYDDPAARLCHPTGGTPAETPHPGSDWVDACRATFVLTSIMLLAP